MSQEIRDNCQSDAVESPGRRTAMRVCGCAVIGVAADVISPASAKEVSEARPDIGDRLVRSEENGKTSPLRQGDIEFVGKGVFAFPFDSKRGIVKSGSRLNKVLLLHLTPEQIDEETLKYAAGGVLAYSAICPHQGCEVAGYNSSENSINCFCHFSKFQPTSGGSVMSGPAPKNLPILPLKLEEGVLVVAGKFSSKPGVSA